MCVRLSQHFYGYMFLLVVPSAGLFRWRIRSLPGLPFGRVISIGVVAAEALCPELQCPELRSDLPKEDVSFFQIADRKTCYVRRGRGRRVDVTEIGSSVLLARLSKKEVMRTETKEIA